MKLNRFAVTAAVYVLTCLLASAVVAQQRPAPNTPGPDPHAAQLVGHWEVVQTKAPGEPFKAGYKGRPFMSKGPNAFALFIEYHKDGTFRRTTRVDATETVHEGTWKLSGHELRHERLGAQEEEIMYIRFDGPDEYTSVDVYEGTPDPGLFGRFKRVK